LRTYATSIYQCKALFLSSLSLRRTQVEKGLASAKQAFQDFHTAKGNERLERRAAFFAGSRYEK
jgi:hypothetical protein